MGCRIHYKVSGVPVSNVFLTLVVPVNAVFICTFVVDLTLSHDCPKWRLFRSQTILIVLTVMTLTIDANKKKKEQSLQFGQ